MPYRLPSHLHRNRCGVLHFRIAIPADLRHHFGMAEVYRSLNTAKVTEAALPAQTLALRFKALFWQLRNESMQPTKKKPSSDEMLTMEWVTEINLDELRRPKSVKFSSEPGDPPGAMESAIRAVLAATSPSAAVEVTADSTVIATSELLSTYVEPYLSSAFVASKPSEKTLESYRAAIVLFIDIVGDKSLNKLAVTDQNRFEDVITRVPANRTKIASARSLSIDEMLELDVPKLSPQTVKNNAQRVNNFLEWSFRREGGKPPFELMNNMRITSRSKTAERRAFSDQELSTLFDPVHYAQGRQRSPYMYWLPLIGLHSGMRINEIAQLDLADIVSRDGIVCFHVTDDDSGDVKKPRPKKVKTDAGRRTVPVHDALISLGLLDYVQMVRQFGCNSLFPDLIGGRDGPGQPASKYFARYCDRVGLRDSRLVFHSFRHGAIGRMRANGVAREVRMVVVGHSAAEDTHDNYGDIKNDFSINDRKRAIQAMDFSGVLDYVRLKNIQPTVAELRDSVTRATVRLQSSRV